MSPRNTAIYCDQIFINDHGFFYVSFTVWNKCPYWAHVTYPDITELISLTNELFSLMKRSTGFNSGTLAIYTSWVSTQKIGSKTSATSWYDQEVSSSVGQHITLLTIVWKCLFPFPVGWVWSLQTLRWLQDTGMNPTLCLTDMSVLVPFSHSRSGLWRLKNKKHGMGKATFDGLDHASHWTQTSNVQNKCYSIFS